MSVTLPYFSDWPQIKSNIPKDDDLERTISEILAQMTLEEKVGQMIQPNLRDVTPEEAKTYKIGSVLNGGGTWVNDDKYSPPADWAKESDKYWNALREAFAERPFWIPFMWASDAVHGHNNIFGATIFPHNIGLGAARDPDLIYRIGRATAKEVCATGMDWTFAPTVATPRNLRWGRTYEGYSEDPKIVYQYAEQMVAGLQGNGDELQGEDHLLATVKHWIGDGGTHDGIDRGNNAYSEEHLINIHATGYFSGLTAGAQVVMSSFSGWINPQNYSIDRSEYNQKLSGSHYLLTQVLKEKMQFDGVIISDWNSHSEVTACSDGNANYCVNAGLDILMVTARNDWQATIKNIIQGVNTGEIEIARINDAVTRILRIKMRAGLWNKKHPSARVNVAQNSLLGAQVHKDLSREAVRKSLVLLKNKALILPLSRSSNILLAGSAIDSIQKMTGGWSLTWQGSDTCKQDFPGCQTLKDAIALELEADKWRELDATSSQLQEDFSDTAIVAIGEDPYAEIVGDIKMWQTLDFGRLKRAYAKDVQLIRDLKAQGKKIIIVFYSGRPLYVNELINLSDAFVSAWLPGTEGLGLTDLLFKNKNDEINYDFSGTLSFSWPNKNDSFAVNAIPQHFPNYTLPEQEQDPNGEHRPLFALGYGLNYSDKQNPHLDLDNLNVDASCATIDDRPAEQNLALFGVMATGDHILKIADGDNWQSGLEATGNNSVSSQTVESHPIDFVHQQDGRHIKCHNSKSLIYLETIDQGHDNLSPYLLANGKIDIAIKLMTYPEKPVLLSIVKDLPQGPSVDITAELTSMPLGEWRSLKIDLSNLNQAGCDMSKVIWPMVLYTDGNWSFHLGSIDWIV